ncbi:MAG TPA: DUF885 family protein [Actinomycetota bacterium]|nr:DUF885 family protein [Actinomycetota bacterium]
MNQRLRALCDLSMGSVREYVGRHEYDGRVEDLSPEGVRAGLARVGGPSQPEQDPHDEAQLAAFERLARLELGELELYRSNPLYHIAALDVSCYDRDYAPEAERAEARRRHLAAWPDAVDAAVTALDRVAAPVAEALLPAARGLTAGLEESAADPVVERALEAHKRLAAHLEAAADGGHRDTALGRGPLERLLGAGEALEVDLGRLEERADAERDRLQAMLEEACGRLAPGRPTTEVVAGLLEDHPDAGGVLREAEAMTAESIAFTLERDLVPGLDGTCLVAPAPPSRRWALAMMSWAAPYEADAPSRYYISPPDPDWPADEQDDWLKVFSRTTLPAITVHEVAPGHFAHGRRLRQAGTDVRRTLQSLAFVEGWAHYGEEVCVEEGFRADDPRFAAGVALEALQRVTRLAVSIGTHAGTMTVADGAARFEADAFCYGPAARAESSRATFDPTYGRYTWGKLEILRLRDQARARWGAGFSLQRFHDRLLRLGAPPLGLMATALETPNGRPRV